MRLLNTSSLDLEEFISAAIPEYVILSHTWGLHEVSLQDLNFRACMLKEGYMKILGCCREAARNGYEYVWIDTCCIDKTSSSELSEAINSMYQWYQNASVCYAHLSDVTISTSPSQLELFKALGKSRWFSRGWTLQELLAPNIIEFYDSDWSEIGTKATLSKTLSDITGIRFEVLRGLPLDSCNVAERMSWAASRITTRPEDMAYCLFGVFGVHMPLIYGEGGEKAFLRLQEEILRSIEDYTIFAWTDPSSNASIGLFAHSVTAFKSPHFYHANWPRHIKSSDLQHCDGGNYFSTGSESYTRPEPPLLTSRGLRVTFHAREHSQSILGHQKELHVFLNCLVGTTRAGQVTQQPLLLRLRECPTYPGTFERISSAGNSFWAGDPLTIPTQSGFWITGEFELRTLYVTRSARGDLAKVSTFQKPTAFQLILDPGLQHLSPMVLFPRYDIGWFVPCLSSLDLSPQDKTRKGWIVSDSEQQRGPVSLLLGDRCYMLVSAGVIDDKPWCYIQDCMSTIEHNHSEIPKLLSEWHHSYKPELASRYDDRAIARTSSGLEVHVSIKKRAGRHVVGNTSHEIFSLQIRVKEELNIA